MISAAQQFRGSFVVFFQNAHAHFQRVTSQDSRQVALAPGLFYSGALLLDYVQNVV